MDAARLPSIGQRIQVVHDRGVAAGGILAAVIKLHQETTQGLE
jgi:hypothetical protein